MKTTVPFSTGFAIILTATFFAWQAISQASALNAASQTAIAENFAVAATTTTPSMPTTVAMSSASSTIKPGLLPVVALSLKKPQKQKVAVAATTPMPAPAPKSAAIPFTTQSFLTNTSVSVTSVGGAYKAIFTTKLGGGKTLTWGLGAVMIGGTNSVPSMSLAFSCDPIPNLPAAADADQTPTFNVRTSYTCAVSLTPLSGNDQRTQSQSFSFATGAGRFSVTQPPAMNVILKNGENDGGFVFDNEDAVPVTVTGLTLDVSYTALNIATSPLLLQVIDPVTDLPLADQHLENIAADSSLAYIHTGIDLAIPLSFVIKPTSKKMLPLQILGVHTMEISNVDPSLSITLRNITTDQASNTAAIQPVTLSWSCVVPLVPYDPNATSGPYAEGTACQ